MNPPSSQRALAALLALLAGFSGCTKERPVKEIDPSASSAASVRHHEHHAPHGGTPVVLGEEAYHLELVLDAAEGKLQAYVLDGELENFVRSVMPSFDVVANVGGSPRTLKFEAIANPATGESVGDTSLFEAKADWLKTTASFDGVVSRLTIRGTTFSSVKFNFP